MSDIYFTAGVNVPVFSSFTEREAQILSILCKHIEEYNISPLQREIGAYAAGLLARMHRLETVTAILSALGVPPAAVVTAGKSILSHVSEDRRMVGAMPKDSTNSQLRSSVEEASKSQKLSIVARETLNVLPINKRFRGGTKVTWRYWNSASYDLLDAPNVSDPQEADIFLHRVERTGAESLLQVWICLPTSNSLDCLHWKDVTKSYLKNDGLTRHPRYSDRVLSRPSSGGPNFILESSYKKKVQKNDKCL